MKKQLLVYILLAGMIAVSANATCYDSDGGPKNIAEPARYIGIDGFVSDGNQTYYDTCISRKGGSEVDDSLWIREYYCDSNGNVAYEDYFCPSHYYVECLKIHKAAACDDYSGPSDYNETSLSQANTTSANTTNSATAANNQVNATAVSVNCGNQKVDLGEECDPPGKACYTKAFTSGVCDFNCFCDPALTHDLFQKLNRTINSNNEKSENSSASITFEASSAAEKQDADIFASEKDSSPAITGAAAIDPVTDLIKEVKKPSENFSNTWGIKITSAITRAVMSIWDILMNAIGG